jgi:hypothetical protein
MQIIQEESMAEYRSTAIESQLLRLISMSKVEIFCAL